MSALAFLLTAAAADAQTARSGAWGAQQEPPLRLWDSVETIVADLEGFVPGYMREEDIPGVTIALVRDGGVVWQKGYGVANALTGRKMTSRTLCEVASNSKVVTAYIALRLVDQGLLSLDKPLNSYLPEPWLPPSEYRDAITLRHVLSHSSGLGHNTTSRNSLFAPGSRYSYSAIGIQYLQAVIEQVTGRGLEGLAQEIVFTPIGMSSSSFLNRPDLSPLTANGHVHAALPAILFMVLYLASVFVVGFIVMVITRVLSGTWQPTRWGAMNILTVGFVLSIVPPFVLLRMVSLMEFAWLIAFCGLALIVAFTLAHLFGRSVITRLTKEQSAARGVLTAIWSVLILVGLAWFVGRITNVPVPRWPQTQPLAAGSMRAAAGDMAAFLIELSNPRHLSARMTAQMRRPQVELDDDLSWGLGPGIQRGRQGDALWQWGQHIDFQSIMIIYPKHDFGVVVCTNSDLFNPDVALEIAHRALGGKIEPMRRAIHLEFN